MGSVTMTDHPRTIRGQEPVLAELEARILMRAFVDIGMHTLRPTQYEHRVLAGLLGVEAARRANQQLLEPAQANCIGQLHDLTSHD